eukprot:3416395-Lingulodinium_polyedra.AAC.1
MESRWSRAVVWVLSMRNRRPSKNRRTPRVQAIGPESGLYGAGDSDSRPVVQFGVRRCIGHS